MRTFFTFLIGLVSLMPHTDLKATEPQNKALVLILLGPPGSGKGTQATKLCQKLEIPHISTGDLFRYNIKNNTPLGAQVKSFMDAGKLVPDSLVLDMLFDRLKNPDCKNGFLLDGSPRTVSQAEAIDNYLKTIPHRTLVINLAVPDEEVIKRITGRRTCSQCGKIYHIQFSPPRIENQCDA
jgi:adenylate kinase